MIRARHIQYINILENIQTYRRNVHHTSIQMIFSILSMCVFSTGAAIGGDGTGPNRGHRWSRGTCRSTGPGMTGKPWRSSRADGHFRGKDQGQTLM